MNEWNNQKDKIVGYYSGLISEYGHNPRACDYGRPESQQKKFNVLSDIVTQNHKTLLDVGCGFADYAGFLHDKYPHIKYSGVDITPEFIAQEKINNKNLDLRHLDIMNDDPGQFDIVTANGIFYLLDQDAEKFMQDLIKRMFALSLNAVAFNSLSAWCNDQEEGEFYADPLKTLEFCRSLSPWVTLRHDYHDRDFTIYMYREQVE